MREYLTTKDVAERLDIKTNTVTYYIRTGQLPAIRLGGGYRIDEADLMDFLENRKTANKK